MHITLEVDITHTCNKIEREKYSLPTPYKKSVTHMPSYCDFKFRPHNFTQNITIVTPMNYELDNTV